MARWAEFVSNLRQERGQYTILSMDNDSKLFVFDRKEIILIFVFVVVISATAFTLGVRIGKGVSLKNDGYTEKDINEVTLKSKKEEEIDELLAEGDQKITPESLEKLSLEKVDQNLNEAKKDKAIRKENKMEDLTASDIPESDDIFSGGPSTVQEKPLEENSLKLTKEGSKDKYSGKYTVQIGSFDNLSDAKEFAETFLLRGYDVIIRQVELKERGTYFRVSIGAYNTFKQAESFIEQERSLFSDQDKIIKRFD